MPQGPTSLATSPPKGTEDKESLGFPSEGWQRPAHNAPDMLGPGQWGARPCSQGFGEKLSRSVEHHCRQESHLHPWRQDTRSSWKMTLSGKGTSAFLSSPSQAIDLPQPDIPAGKKVLMGATELGGCPGGAYSAWLWDGMGYSGFHSRSLWGLPGRLCVGRGAVRNRAGTRTPELLLPAV